MTELRLVLAQLNPTVGDIAGNLRMVLEAVHDAQREHNADLVVFPELMLTGYPPEDLLLRPGFLDRAEAALDELCAGSGAAAPQVILGYPRRRKEGLVNAAGLIRGGKIIAEYAKQCLPNYQVFDEKRYFIAGAEAVVVDIGGLPVGLSICEDLWEPAPARMAAEAGAKLLLNLNASPFHRGKQEERQALLAERVQETGLPIVYVNLLGGQDELVFDGGSMAMDAQGALCFAAPCFRQGMYSLDIRRTADGSVEIMAAEAASPLPDVASVYEALLLGVRDYLDKNGFPSALLGLSGGIDSALSLAVAADALGPERVQAVMMPSPHTATMSVEDAEAEARALGVRFHNVSIEPMYDAFSQALKPLFPKDSPAATWENMQARCRGVLLMALSNSSGALVLTTGNKSEMAVGYATLYGDMAGGFDVLKDVPKTLVYELARYRNGISPDIPERVLSRAPSAELSPGQRDDDSLPPYDVLDPILELYVEKDMEPAAIIAAGFAQEQVRKAVSLVVRNEYKRRQAPLGIRISRRGFGRDRRYPITSAWPEKS